MSRQILSLAVVVHLAVAAIVALVVLKRRLQKVPCALLHIEADIKTSRMRIKLTNCGFTHGVRWIKMSFDNESY